MLQNEQHLSKATPVPNWCSRLLWWQFPTERIPEAIVGLQFSVSDDASTGENIELCGMAYPLGQAEDLSLVTALPQQMEHLPRVCGQQTDSPNAWFNWLRHPVRRSLLFDGASPRRSFRLSA
jgi:hypothetical protein